MRVEEKNQLFYSLEKKLRIGLLFFAFTDLKDFSTLILIVRVGKIRFLENLCLVHVNRNFKLLGGGIAWLRKPDIFGTWLTIFCLSFPLFVFFVCDSYLVISRGQRIVLIFCLPEEERR